MPENEVFRVELKNLRDDVSEMRTAVARIAEAMATITRLEERHASLSSALERAFSAISKLSERTSALELAQVPLQGSSAWVDRAVGALVTGAALALAKGAGLI